MIPISRGREGVFLLVFTVQYVGGLLALGLLGWLYSGVSYIESVRLITVLVIVATTNSILLVEGIPMVAERYLERRFQEGKAEGEETGRARGEKLGQARGEKNNQQRWEAWNRRRLEAEARNEPFTEPPPSLDVEDED